MIINFIEQYKSIPPGGKIQLPKFVVLSGRNGSGKTQLFNGMQLRNTSSRTAAKEALKIFVVDDNGAEVTRITYLNAQSLSVRNNSIANPITMETQYESLLKDLNNTLPTARNNISLNNANRAYVIRHQSAVTELLTRARSEDRKIIKYDEMIESIRSFEPPSNIFDDQFSVKFVRYFTDKRKNKINKFLSEQEGENVSYLSDEEFLDKYGPPPWELIGEVLLKSNIPYTVTFPTHHKDPFVAELISQKDPNTKIQFSDLSSGERTLCKLALAIYQSKTDAKFPELLLLDEPDSHLHPGMTKQLLDTLVDSFLPHISIGIIVATHSPSTCALAPDGSLYHMDYDTRRPKEIDIDDALEELCIGIPTLSIRKENERQVIVESDVDAELYSQFWLKTKQMLQLEKTPTLNFISSGKGWRDGSCEQAIDLCNKLRDGGSSTSFAIIDHDGKHTSTDFIFVLGDGQGYSIENFVLSPLAVAGMLIHHHGDSSKYDFLGGLTFYEFCNIDNTQRQEVSIAICKYIEEKIAADQERKAIYRNYPAVSLSEEQVETLTLSGVKILVPKWVLETRGHDLEKIVLATFQELLQYGREDEAGKLMKSIFTHVYAQIPNLIPTSMVKTFKKLIR